MSCNNYDENKTIVLALVDAKKSRKQLRDPVPGRVARSVPQCCKVSPVTAVFSMGL